MFGKGSLDMQYSHDHPPGWAEIPFNRMGLPDPGTHPVAEITLAPGCCISERR